MRQETNPPLSGVGFDIGVPGLESHLWNEVLQPLAIEALKPHEKYSKACPSETDKRKKAQSHLCAFFYITTPDRSN